MAAAPLIIHNGVFLTMAPGSDPFTGWMEVGADGRIAAIGTGEPDRADLGRVQGNALDVRGAFVGPGFVSAHSHLFTSASRGLALDQTLYGWVEQLFHSVDVLADEDIYWLTLHGSLDFLNNGITTAYDFTHGGAGFDKDHAQDGAFVGELRPPVYGELQFKAKIDAGIRFVNSVMLDDAIGGHDDVLARLDHLVGYANGFASNPLYLRSAISGAVQWAADRSTAEIEVEAMHRHGLINQPHFLETAFEAEAQQSKFGWYRDAGALGPDLVFGHFVQTTEEIIVEAAHHGCGMVWQPTSNGRLASGIANVPRCRELGMRVGVGLDDQACTDVSDPFQNMRIGIYLQRALHKDPAAMPVRDMLELHTLGSARVLGIDHQVGSLEVGKFADFVVVDPRRPDTGPVWDAYGTYVLASSLRNLTQVWVGGRLVSEDGVIVHMDADEVSAQVHERVARARRDQAAVRI
jgi:5-methylthioadenosine/S-adenosylhomocysteine deaminase